MESKVLYSPSLQRWVLLIRWIWYHLLLIRPHLYLQLRSFLSVENLCIPQLDQISNSHLICRNSIIDVSRLCPSSRFLNSTNDTIIHSDAQSKHKAKHKPESHCTDFYGPHQTHQQSLFVLHPNIFDSPPSLSVLIAATLVHTTVLSQKRMGNCLSTSLSLFSLTSFPIYNHQGLLRK